MTDSAYESISQNTSTSSNSSPSSMIGSAFATETDNANGSYTGGQTIATYSNTGNQNLSYSSSSSTSASSGGSGTTTISKSQNTTDNTDLSSWTETGGYTTSAGGTMIMPSSDNPGGYQTSSQTATYDALVHNKLTMEQDTSSTNPNGSATTSGTYTGDASASTHSKSTITVDVPNNIDSHGGNYSLSGSKSQHSDYLNKGNMVMPKMMSVSWSYETQYDRLGTLADSGNYTSPETPGSVTTSVSSSTSTGQTVTTQFWDWIHNSWGSAYTSSSSPTSVSNPGPTVSSDGGESVDGDAEGGGWGTAALDAIQVGLDIAGFVPGLGEVADGISGLISLARGDKVGALMSFASMIPFAGWGAGAAKIGRQVMKHGDEAVGLVAKGINKIDDVGSLKKIGSQADEICTGGACFGAGTPILTAKGARPIEAMRPGDVVLSRAEGDPAAPLAPHTVGALFERTAQIWELHLAGRCIETTAEHPIYVIGEGWVPTVRLRPGDAVIGHDQKASSVDRIVPTNRTVTVYNLRVEESHTYFVGDDCWGFSVWVHNASYPKGGIDAVKKGERGVAASEAEAVAAGETILGKEVTFELPSGKRTKSDILTKESDDALKVREAKNGPTATLTAAQKEMQDCAAKAVPVTPRGANAAKAGLTPGEKVLIEHFELDMFNL